jgi:hypothetical protein
MTQAASTETEGVMASSRRFLIGSALLLAVASRLAASGVVGTGTAGSCTESALDTALSGGGSVTFDCGGGPVTITLTATKSITAATTIDGANLITLSGGGTVKLFDVTGGGLTIDNLALVDGHDTASDIGAAAIDASADKSISRHHQRAPVTHGDVPGQQPATPMSRIRRSRQRERGPAAGVAVCGNNTSTATAQTARSAATPRSDQHVGNRDAHQRRSRAILRPAPAIRVGSRFRGTVTLVDTIVANNTGDAGQGTSRHRHRWRNNPNSRAATAARRFPA